MTTTAFPGRQAHSRAAAAPRATALHLGVGSSGSLPAPPVGGPAAAGGATPDSNPAPLPPLPPGPGLDARRA